MFHSFTGPSITYILPVRIVRAATGSHFANGRAMGRLENSTAATGRDCDKRRAGSRAPPEARAICYACGLGPIVSAAIARATR
jgi:hypothetical protein